MFRKTAVVIVLFTCCMLFAACGSKNMKKVDVKQKVRFSGTLRYEMFYGAPGFGEDTVNDDKEPCYILHTDRPFLFRDTILATDFGIDIQTCPYDTVSAIQIRVDHESNKYARSMKGMVNKEITVECTLYGAHTGHHHAPALTEGVFSITESK